jgi:hypothetical protein
MKAKLLLLAPLGLALSACGTMDLGGLLGVPSTSYSYPSYGTYGSPGYAYPGQTYSYPAQTYSYPGYASQPYGYSYGQPAVVAPQGSYYSYGATASDWDGDRVPNTQDRFPYDRARW